MIRLFVHLADLNGNFIEENKSISFGKSYISAFESHLISMEFSGGNGFRAIWVGEGSDPYAQGDPAKEKGMPYAQISSLEGVKLFLKSDDIRSDLYVVRSSCGTTPLYVSVDHSRISISWLFEDAFQVISNPKPNIEACRIFIENNASYVRDQVIDGVYMIWPGETVEFSDKGLLFREAAESEIALPGSLSDSARATNEFVRLIGEALHASLPRAANPLLELSGGLDSSCVAIAAKSVRTDICSYGLIHQGAMGNQQRNRRREILGLLGFDDFEYPSNRHTPLAALDHDELSLTPNDDNHRLSCTSAIDGHPSGKFDLVISGIGGDELMLENTFLRHDWELRGNICASSIDAAVARSDMFMRRGIWPKNPLTYQPLVDFCRSLPARMKRNRLANILVLARYGLSDGFLFPRFHEHYGVSMQHEAALFDYDAALRQSIVADYQIANVSELISRAHEASYGGFSYDLIGKLYNLLKLEKVLSRYIS